jgi:hypothetical protein
MSVFIKNQTIGPNCGCIDCNADPCAVAEATLVFDGISSSKYKFGYDEYFGYVSTPPKIYVKKTLGGYVKSTQFVGFSYPEDNCTVCEASQNIDYSGYCEYSPKGSSNVSNYSSEQITTCFNTDRTTNYCTNCNVVNYNPCDITGAAGGIWDTSFTSTNKTIVPNINYCYYGITIATSYLDEGYASATLSDEFTTTQLISLTISSLPSFSGNFNSTSYYAGRELTLDQRSFTYSVFQYKFILPAYDTLKYYKCYKINWQLKYQPTVGEPIVANYNYIWNGTDSSTPVYGPVVPPDGLNDPDSIIFVTNVTYSCSCT